ncbi:MAG: L-ribulose-5-phosphate 3-epimerase [Erysipelotrichaceae bacterium]
MVNRYRLGLYEKAMPNHLSWEEKLAFAKSANYDWIEISIDATDEKINRIYWSKEERNQLVTLMQKYELYCETMNVSSLTKYALGSRNPETVAKGMEIVMGAIDLATDLGVRLIQIPGYDVYFEEGDDETNQRYLENLKKVVYHAAHKGIALGLETMENNYMNTVTKAMRVVNLMKSPYLNIYPDVGNITNAIYQSETKIYDDMMRGEAHIVAVHLKETKPNIYREVPYGTGHSMFEGAIQAAKDMGISMFLGEFWCIDEENWKEECIDSNQFLRKKIETVFD